jgi:hypothetical protein
MKLSLDSASKSAEIVAAIAVVLSLIYVGYQVQQNTKAIRSTVHQSLVGHVTATEGLVVTNADLAQIMLKSDSNPDSLTPEERLRFDAFITLEFVNWENAYLNYQEGFVEERVWQA